MSHITEHIDEIAQSWAVLKGNAEWLGPTYNHEVAEVVAKFVAVNKKFLRMPFDSAIYYRVARKLSDLMCRRDGLEMLAGAAELVRAYEVVLRSS